MNSSPGKSEDVMREKGIKTKEQKSFDEVLHKLLIIGLILSVILILIGLALSLATHQKLPSTVPSLNTVFAEVFALNPAGFIGLGLLVLIATPIVRVISSVIAFTLERDWKFAGITLIVLITVVISILLGSY